jgi:hypothetical protein
MVLNILRLQLISRRINMYTLCDTCPAFCAEDNWDGYLCDGCDPYVYDDEYEEYEGDENAE